MNEFMTVFALIITTGGIIPVMIGWTLGTFVFGSSLIDSLRSGIINGFVMYVGSYLWLIWIVQ